MLLFLTLRTDGASPPTSSKPKARTRLCSVWIFRAAPGTRWSPARCDFMSDSVSTTLDARPIIAPQYRPITDAALALEDGRIFRGRAFGATGIGEGEAVFTTTMTGYQEVCTDPSFRRQLVCMTFPLIGNYGVNEDDDQSRQPWIAGLIVREHCDD